MSFSSARLDAEIDRPPLDGLQRVRDVAGAALRASAVVLLDADGDASALLNGGTDGLDTALALRDAALASVAPVRGADGGRAWLAVGFRLGARRAVLCVAAPAPRTFDDGDIATLAAVGALVETPECQARLPLQAIADLSGTLLRDAEAAALPADALRAAADSLEAVARRLRELSAAPAQPCATMPDAPGTARILLADDLDLNRRLIADMLSLDGHRVDCVSDGAAAVRAVAAERYDLVLMDMIMPDMDGLAATRAIRALPRPARDVPIVALTANAMRDQLDSCLEAGMDAALTKPMSIEALNAAVAQWTRGRNAAA